MPQKKKLSEKVDKRHRGRVRIGVDRDGKPLYKYVSGDTKAELERERQRVKDYYIGGEAVEREQSFEKYATEWFETFKAGQVSHASEEMYRIALYHHLIPKFKHRQIGAIRASDIQAVLNANSSKSYSTVKKIAMTASQIFRQAYANGIVDRDPTVALRITGQDSKERRALTEAEVKATLKIAKEHDDGLLLSVLYYLGVRIGEALGLSWEDINFDAKTAHIQRDIDLKRNEIGTVKTAASNRFIPIPAALYDELIPLRKDSGFVLTSAHGSFIGRSSYKRLWDNLMAALYVADPTIERIESKKSKKARKTKEADEEIEEQHRSMLTAHYYRHNYATILHAAGVPVLQARDWLGHSNIQTTINIYTHLDKEKTARKAAEAQDFFR